MSPLQRGEKGRRTCVLRPVVWAVMSGETGEIGVSDHFREVTKMIVPESGPNGKSRAICSIPDSSDLKSPIRCATHRSTLCTLRKREAITPTRTQSRETAHAVHGLQKRGMVKFVCVVGNFFAIRAGIESARDFRGFFPPNIPYFNRRAFRNGRPSAYFFSSIIPYNFISSMRSFASLMEPDALLSAPDCSPA